MTSGLGAGRAAARRHLVLAGGGHAHVEVLRRLAMERERPPVTVVTPSAHAVYSGMVPSLVAGRLGIDDVRIDVAALAARAGANFVPDRIVSLDLGRRRAVTTRHGEIPWDVLSLDIGSRTAAPAGLADVAHVVAVRPIEQCISRVEAFVERARRGEVAPCAVIVGAGAGGIELAFSLARILGGLPGPRVVLLERGPAILAGASRRARVLVGRKLAARGIEVLCDAGDVRPTAVGVATGDGRDVPAALAIWATGARGPEVLGGSGLALDAGGFVLVDDHLRALGRDDVFAVGDCARLASHPEMPRAGVFAVRQGPPLFANVRARSRGEEAPARYRPQRAFLSLLATGDGGAIALWRGLAASGAALGRLKDRIDRRFIARYAPPRRGSLRPVASAMSAAVPCGGCAAKLDAAVLGTLLGDLPAGAASAGTANVTLGLAARDDAAVLRHPPGEDVVVTVDGFPPFSGDLHAVGEIGAVNAASDVYAMGGEPTAALLLLSATATEGAARDAELALLLGGAAAGLERLGIPLVGGHTLSAGTALVAFAVLGRLTPGGAMIRGGARPGDALVFTKPLGTGVVLAAARVGACPASWTDAALASMRLSNGPAARRLREAGVRCCTDVTGFGLVGHLEEVMSASGATAIVDVASIPSLPGARELLAAGWRSSAHASNRRALERTRRELRVDGEPSIEILCDPQTSGGLLAAVDPARIDGLLAALRADGTTAWRIGSVSARSDTAIELVARSTGAATGLTNDAPGL